MIQKHREWREKRFRMNSIVTLCLFIDPYLTFFVGIYLMAQIKRRTSNRGTWREVGSWQRVKTTVRNTENYYTYLYILYLWSECLQLISIPKSKIVLFSYNPFLTPWCWKAPWELGAPLLLLSRLGARPSPPKKYLHVPVSDFVWNKARNTCRPISSLHK